MEVVGVCVHCVESQLILAETCMDDGIHLNIGRGRATYRDHQSSKRAKKRGGLKYHLKKALSYAEFSFRLNLTLSQSIPN